MGRLGLRFDSREEIGPAMRHTLAMFFRQPAECGVAEGDESAALLFRQSVLNVREERGGSKQRSGDFEECRPLNGLNVSPEVTVGVAQIGRASCRERVLVTV